MADRQDWEHRTPLEIVEGIEVVQVDFRTPIQDLTRIHCGHPWTSLGMAIRYPDAMNADESEGTTYQLQWNTDVGRSRLGDVILDISRNRRIGDYSAVDPGHNYFFDGVDEEIPPKVTSLRVEFEDPDETVLWSDTDPANHIDSPSFAVLGVGTVDNPRTRRLLDLTALDSERDASLTALTMFDRLFEKYIAAPPQRV